MCSGSGSATRWFTPDCRAHAVDLLIKRDFAPAAERLRAVISREKAIPVVSCAARRNLKQPPREFTELAIRMAKGSLGFFEGPVAAWAGRPRAQDNELLAEFQAKNARVIAAFRSVRHLARRPT